MPTDPYASFGYTFGNDDNMKNWEYVYDLFEPTFSYNGENYTDVYTVLEEEDASQNVPITDPQFIAFKTRSVEKYSKTLDLFIVSMSYGNINRTLPGLILIISGFGITMWMIDHN